MTDEFPLLRYRGGVFVEIRRTRKKQACDRCGNPIPVGARAWTPFFENIRGGLNRTARLCHECGVELQKEGRSKR